MYKEKYEIIYIYIYNLIDFLLTSSIKTKLSKTVHMSVVICSSAKVPVNDRCVIYPYIKCLSIALIYLQN